MSTNTAAGPPPTKKTKVEEINGVLIDALWSHYRDYLDSVSDGGTGEGDVDNLQELIALATPLFPVPLTIPDDDQQPSRILPLHSRQALIPVLLSVAHYHLADVAISDYLALLPQLQPHQVKSDLQKIQTILTTSLMYFPQNAAAWSMGANLGRMTHSLMPPRVLQWYERAVETSSTVRKHALEALEEEEEEGENGIDDDDDDDEGGGEKESSSKTSEEVNEWIELLLLNQVCGVEYEPDDEDDEDEEQGGGDHSRDKNGHVTSKKAKEDKFENEFDSIRNGEEDDSEELHENPFENEYSERNVQDNNNVNDDNDDDEGPEGEGQYSASSVEATARFMCAMLLSTGHRHEEALVHLKRFPLTHRLHPNVWNVSSSSTRQSMARSQPTGPPLMFQPSEGILPPHLYAAMKKLFAPESPYWIESDYSNRGYYSYFMDYDKTAKMPSHLLEEVIVHHLLPRAQQTLDLMNKKTNHGGDDERGNEELEICGFEWWAHTRAIQANLGHNLHFDTDESMLAQQGKVTHPILSSVLYLTGGTTTGKNNDNDDPSAGVTIILDETPNAKEVASNCWQGIPQDNSFLVFPGDCLHGVLPCPGENTRENVDKDDANKGVTTTDDLILNSWRKSTNKASNKKETTPHRLTFMVGFWTRNVPATMKKRTLYGPCGPLPPAGMGEHTWVDEIHQHYDSDGGTGSREYPMAPKTMDPTAVPCVSPAWEKFETDVNLDDNSDDASGPPLSIPHTLDHRFFVRDAPQCFRRSLFEDQEVGDDRM